MWPSQCIIEGFRAGGTEAAGGQGAEGGREGKEKEGKEQEEEGAKEGPLKLRSYSPAMLPSCPKACQTSP